MVKLQQSSDGMEQRVRVGGPCKGRGLSQVCKHLLQNTEGAKCSGYRLSVTRESGGAVHGKLFHTMVSGHECSIQRHGD